MRRATFFTHLDFSIAYNGRHIIEVNVSADPLQRVDLAQSNARDVEFSYSVRWLSSDIDFSDRMSRYAQYSFLPQSFEIHWLSIVNSFVLVLLLTGFLSIILMRVLKNDFVRYSVAVEDDEDDEEETGWKLVHGDVFRLPPAFSTFCAYVGTGAQLFALVFCLLCLAIMNMFYPGNRGAMYSSHRIIRAHGGHRRLCLGTHVLPLLRRRWPVGVESRAVSDSLPRAIYLHFLLPQYGRDRV